MTRKTFLATSLLGFALAILSSAPTRALPTAGAFAPAADKALIPVADYMTPGEPRRRHPRRAVRQYEEQGYAEAYVAEPVYDPAFSYSYLGRYYYPYDRRFYLRGFNGSPASYYYW